MRLVSRYVKGHLRSRTKPGIGEPKGLGRSCGIDRLPVRIQALGTAPFVTRSWRFAGIASLSLVGDSLTLCSRGYVLAARSGIRRQRGDSDVAGYIFTNEFLGLYELGASLASQGLQKHLFAERFVVA